MELLHYGYGGSVGVRLSDSSLVAIFMLSLMYSQANPGRNMKDGNIELMKDPANPMKNTVLVIEDEALTRRSLCDRLNLAGYEVTSAVSGEEGLSLIEQGQFDVILTDLQMQRVNGIQVAAAAREHDPDAKTIILTGFAGIDTAVEAIRQRVFAYIIKPGATDEVERTVAEALEQRQHVLDQKYQLRILGEGLLRAAGVASSEPMSQEGVLVAGPLRMNRISGEVSLYGKSIDLTPGEFDVLMFLARERGHVISGERLISEVWGYTDTTDATPMVKARIWALRRKIEKDLRNPTVVVTVRGLGYRFDL